MNRLNDKIVFISGASSGIGKACAFAFAKENAKLIISSRTNANIENTADEIRKKFNVEVLAFSLDVTDRHQVENKISSLPNEWKNIDILINNAGLGRSMNKLYEDNIDGWEEMIDTNVKGLLYVTRSIVPQMVKRKTGHIINIGSIAGHEVYPGGSVYCATKHAVTAITKTLRMELIDKGIRVSTVDPGMVETNFSVVRFYGDKEKAKNAYKGLTPLVGEDIAEAVIFCANRPPHANINEIVIMPSVQASAMVNYREC